MTGAQNCVEIAKEWGIKQMQIVFCLCAERSGLQAKFYKVKYPQFDYYFLQLIPEFMKLIVLKLSLFTVEHVNKVICAFADVC